MTAGDPAEVLRAILADPEFESEWQERVFEWLGSEWKVFARWLDGLPSGARWVIVGVSVTILGWLLWTMIAGYREMMAPPATAGAPEADSAGRGPTPRELAAQAKQLAAQGRSRESARMLQQAVYIALAARQSLAWDGARADWEWVARLGGGAELASFTEQAQSVAYGTSSEGARGFDALWAGAQRWVGP